MLDWNKMQASVERFENVEQAVEKLLTDLNEAIADARNACPTDTQTQIVLNGLQQRITERTEVLAAAVAKNTPAEGAKKVDVPETAPAGSISQADGQTAGDGAANPATDAPPPRPPMDNPVASSSPKRTDERPASPGNAPYYGGNTGSGKTSDQAASAVEKMGANPNDDSSMPPPRDTSGPQPADEGKTGPLGG